MLVPNGLAAIVAQFGDPVRYVNAKELWEETRLVAVSLPVPLPYAYGPLKVLRVKAHRSLVHELINILMRCYSAGVSPERMKYGGVYSWRPKRSNGTELSTHTWGIAIDIEPVENPQGRPWVDDGVMLDPVIVEQFERAHWNWGGRWERPDAMHFQFATGY